MLLYTYITWQHWLFKISLFDSIFNLHKLILFIFSENLWKSRRPPKPISWEEANSYDQDIQQLNETSVKTTDMQVWSISKCAKIFASSISILKKELSNKTFLVWDKDDKPAMDFVTACANIRAHIFSIPQKSRFDIKCMYYEYSNIRVYKYSIIF